MQMSSSGQCEIPALKVMFSTLGGSMQNPALKKSQNSTLEKALLVVVLMVAAFVILSFFVPYR
jgi:hypothetical protein